ncbi:MAG: tRNA epoxyqueuosine(34) reductase QueG, partial [Mesorhizobium sp.]
ALSRLVPGREFAERAAAALQAEDDEAVRGEWLLALPKPIEAHT